MDLSSLRGKTVLVTGVSGFLGSHVAKAALSAGLNVKGTVRSLETYAGEAALKDVQLVELDLVSATAADWEEAAKGCDYACHVASPFTRHIKTEHSRLEDTGSQHLCKFNYAANGGAGACQCQCKCKWVANANATMTCE